MSGISRFSTSFLILVLALFLQIHLGDLSGIWINFSLATLITVAFFLDLFQLSFLILFAVLILNWQPAPSWELTVFSAVPLIVFMAKKLLPLQPWLNNIFMIFLGTILFYVFIDPRFVLQNFKVFLTDFAAVTLFGILVFSVERVFSPEQR